MRTCLLALLASALLAGCSPASESRDDRPSPPTSPEDEEAYDDDRAEPTDPSEDDALPRKLPAGARLAFERNNIAVFRKMAPATVFVTQKRIVRDRWSLRALEVPSGTGSGFLWDKKGHVVTNAHVVSGARSLEVALWDGSTYEAKLVGADPNKDMAVLKIDAPASKLVPVQLPPAGATLEVGQAAIAIGNPFGLDHTMTTGVISALGREVKGFGGVSIRDMIQTDASINPGNSGGPLIDSTGKLIGMNTMIYSKSGSSAGIGFAVPVTELRRIVPQLITYGKPRRAGLLIELVPDNVARANGIKGVAIAKVERGGPAAKAGLQGLSRSRRGVFVGDVIVGIGKHAIASYDDLYQALDRRKPGDKVNVKYVRGDELFEVEVTLAEIP